MKIKLTAEELKQSLAGHSAPEGISAPLQALWTDGKGEWDAAHKIVQSESDSDSAWVHAYLHRKEGDLSNASYWYHRAGKAMPQIPLADEWQSITEALLQD